MEQKSLLLVEDDPVFSEVLGRTLSQHGFDLEYAQNSVTAKERLSKKSFDLAILDLNLGDHNSLSLIEPLRKKKQRGKNPDTYGIR